MASSNALWVFGVVRLISSARTILEKIGPGLNSKSLLLGLKTEMPRTSEGSRSLVNWIRWKLQARARAIAWPRVVLPTPGTSSIRRWPSAIRATTASWIISSLPLTVRATALQNALTLVFIPSADSSMLPSNQIWTSPDVSVVLLDTDSMVTRGRQNTSLLNTLVGQA